MQALDSAANTLRSARRDRQAIASLAQSHGIADTDSAYAVSRINLQAELQTGCQRISGYKVGLTSAAMQARMKTHEPVYGVLLSNWEHLSGDELSAHALIHPKVEAEIALVMGRDLLQRRPTWTEFLRALAFALPALEIIDSVYAGWKGSLADTVADNGSAARYVLGLQPVSIAQVDLAQADMELSVNGAVVSTGSGAQCMGHPLRSAFWLAQRLCEEGVGLKAGQVILSGALCPPAPVAAECRIQARINGIGQAACHAPLPQAAGLCD